MTRKHIKLLPMAVGVTGLIFSGLACDSNPKAAAPAQPITKGADGKASVGTEDTLAPRGKMLMDNGKAGAK